MIPWIPYTFVRTVLFFIGGIALGLYSPDLISEKTSFFVVSALALLYVLVVFFGKGMRRALNPGWIALSLVWMLGYVHVVRETESRHVDHLINHEGKISHYQAVVTRFAEERERTWNIEARVLRIHDHVWKAKQGNLILYLSKTDYPRPFQYGDVLLIKGQPQVPDAPANPGGFDYRAYLATKNIYHQHFLRGGEVRKMGYAPPSRFMAVAFRGRDWAETTLNKFIHGAREQAIASALVLGVTDGLDNELINAYSATGTMHILAVSGLHVSILYLILLWIFKPLNRFRGGRWFVACAALLILWLYALVTGLSPSVLRAVTMFSFLAVARPASRSTNIYNTLAVSAFCLLLYDPFLIRSVGFQLSYLAVLGIVYLYPRILNLWEPRHAFTTKVWKLSAVSIAAQIATFPVGLLYFHQFPNYFLLSNLMVVPISSGVLVTGLAILAVSFAPPLAALLGYCLEVIIRFLNGIVFTMEGLPFSLIDNIFITPWQCALIVLLIMTVLALTQHRQFNYVIFASLILAAYASLQWIHVFKDVNVRKMTVYKVPGHTGIDLFDRGQALFIADSVLRYDLEKIRYHIAPNRLKAGVEKVDTSPAVVRNLDGGRLVGWNGKMILLLTDNGFRLPEGVVVDWLIISNNAGGDVDRIARRITCKKVVLDSSNSFFFASRFLEAAKLHKLDVHSVLHQGAFIAKIENDDT